MQVPVTVLNASTKREQGRKAQVGNIAAAKVCLLSLAAVIRHLHPVWLSDLDIVLVGRVRHYQNNSWAPVYVEDAAGPKWR